ncbi:conserved hypothetical protein [Halorubrum lacusprofundi ATCC 49239]|jgi:hypothetical protein|uniref:DUF4382 domain-containing protein n=1 Tax=Halorubrum lacusprofundi (strain ATCC 49239 / DSM 5036 / JCM 8891 / ACAM 34) TaxID=416348 RepID=B9LPF6_HALLT|nr:conserved hypothetical protein [Halorubrum lacusprofundi ATCC 49239]
MGRKRNVTDRTPDFDALDRRTYLQATGAAALGAAGLAGCVGRATGTLATQVTDQPADIADFASLVVTIEGIWLGPEGAESGADGNVTDDGNATDGDDADGNETDGGNQTDGNETDGDEDDSTEPAGREYYEFDEPQEADLVQLQNGETQLIDERELSVGTYRFLQLNVSNVDGTLAEGGEAEVDRPGNAPLTFNAEFDVRENTRTVFTADFAPVRRGNGRYLLRPVPSGIEVDYEETDGDGSDDSGNETE